MNLPLRALPLFAATLCLCGCVSSFVAPPPEAYRAPVQEAALGLWANEHNPKQTERVRARAVTPDTVEIWLYDLDPKVKPPVQQPFHARSYRFGGQDWLIIDRRDMAAASGEKEGNKEDSKPDHYVVLRYTTRGDRLCGHEISSRLLEEAVKSGRLQGTTKGEFMRQTSVTSDGEQWVAWWSALPPSEQKFGEELCLKRVER